MNSTDKIKELLDDFAEKEALAKAEISEIEDQIAELEERIVSSRERLESVAKDKEKVYLMRNRYAEGNWSDVLEKASERIQENKNGAQPGDSDDGVAGDIETAEVSETAGDVTDATETSDTLDQVPEEQIELEGAEAPPSVPVPENPALNAAELNQPEAELPSVPVAPVQQAVAQAPLESPAPPEAPPQMQAPPQPQPQEQAVAQPPAGHDVLPVALDNPEAPPILPGIPNPPTGFDGMQTPPGIANIPQEMQQEAQQPQPQPEGEQSESLFPFSQGHEMGGEMEQDSPWSAPPGMGWETSETGSQFPPGQPPQPPVPPAQPGQPAQQGQQPQLPPQQQAVLQQSQTQVPANAAPGAPQPAENGGFDISDALKPEGEEEEGAQKDDENVKKINDALRGLFS